MGPCRPVPRPFSGSLTYYVLRPRNFASSPSLPPLSPADVGIPPPKTLCQGPSSSTYSAPGSKSNFASLFAATESPDNSDCRVLIVWIRLRASPQWDSPQRLDDPFKLVILAVTGLSTEPLHARSWRLRSVSSALSKLIHVHHLMLHYRVDVFKSISSMDFA